MPWIRNVKTYIGKGAGDEDTMGPSLGLDWVIFLVNWIFKAKF